MALVRIKSDLKVNTNNIICVYDVKKHWFHKNKFQIELMCCGSQPQFTLEFDTEELALEVHANIEKAMNIKCDTRKEILSALRSIEMKLDILYTNKFDISSISDC